MTDSPSTCECCNDARPNPAEYRLFADGCLHCAARRIQYIQRRLPIAPAQKAERCRAALQQAMGYGLPESNIRAMAKHAEWQLVPVKQQASRPRNGG